MAETLSVTDMLPNRFEPKRQYRWIMAIEGIDSFLVKSTARPTITLGTTEIPFVPTIDDLTLFFFSLIM